MCPLRRLQPGEQVLLNAADAHPPAGRPQRPASLTTVAMANVPTLLTPTLAAPNLCIWCFEAGAIRQEMMQPP